MRHETGAVGRQESVGGRLRVSWEIHRCSSPSAQSVFAEKALAGGSASGGGASLVETAGA